LEEWRRDLLGIRELEGLVIVLLGWLEVRQLLKDLDLGLGLRS